MSWLDRVIIQAISPAWAMRRARARLAFNYYEAAETNRLRREKRDRRSANAQNRGAIDSLRSQARHLDQNFDIASGVLDVLVNNTVGSGIAPEPQAMLRSGEPAEEFNRKLLALWDDWIHSPEVTRQLDYYSLQRLIARTLYRDGEAFSQKIIGRVAGLDHNTIVPYSLEALEPDFVPLDLNEPAEGIVQGVRLNAWGQPLGFRVYKSHPGEDTGRLAVDTKEIPAARMIHVKHTKRLHQVRGVSVLATVLNRFDDVKEIDESERVAARVAAAMAAYIKKGTPDLYEAGDHPVDPATGQRTLRSMEMVPGIIFDDLLPGEEIGSIASNRPNNALIPFRDAQLRSGAAGVGATFSSISKNYNGTFSAQRQELVEGYANYRPISKHLVFRLCQPVWDGFVDAVLASGAADARGVDMSTVYDASHTLPAMPWIDPMKEAEALELAEKRGWTSRQRTIRLRGDNPDQINKEIERDAADRDRLGIPAPWDDGSNQAAADAAAAEDREDQRAADTAAAIRDGLGGMAGAIAGRPAPVTHLRAGDVHVATPEVVVNNDVKPPDVLVQNDIRTPETIVNLHVPEPVVNLEATVESPVVHVAAPEVSIANTVSVPPRAPQRIEARKGPDGSMVYDVKPSPEPR